MSDSPLPPKPSAFAIWRWKPLTILLTLIGLMLGQCVLGYLLFALIFA